jgi:cytochrome c-type biogenesis protein CcmH
LIGFWVLAAAMIGLALAFALVPLLRRRPLSALDTEAAELAVYRKRLSELKDELARGILTEPQFERARYELEAAAAAELASLSGSTGMRAQRHWVIAISMAIAVPVLALVLYRSLGAQRELTQYLASVQEAQTREETFRQSLKRLEARLAQTPEDGTGWRLLGRSYLLLGEYTKAADALSRAQALLSEDPELLLDYAQALAGTQGGRAQGAPEKFIERALTLAPEHPRGLWLGAAAALQRGTQAEAKAYLERLLPQVQPGSEVEQQVRSLLVRLQEVAQPGPGVDTAIAPQARIEVRVSLDPKLATGALPTDTVFIFARAPQGPRLPLAVVRKQVKDLPVTIVLDDSQAMAPEMRLSRSPEVMIGARVSRSGDPMPHSGDLEGAAQGPVALADSRTEPVSVIIDRAVP